MQGIYEVSFYRREYIKKKKQSAFYAIIKRDKKFEEAFIYAKK